ncbi:hypothetical protein [Streptomyces hainanensis]|uniref:Uncharacterized protein n=1 Tax=Streptomyces hainanensis TaxID=402648 RepID=A0A4R4U1D3_9ACTN|nr:hypothetical protein [Streptomyces hainanensis]TDC80319.1 hypothetical protein E1283_00520 [Streptomyces hainanensis]
MAGRTDPPEGLPGGAPGAGDEEYQSTVFDESFVRAARLQEFSAQERLEDHTTAVRRRDPEPGRGRTVPRQGIALALIILLAFAAAIYLGNNNPYDTPVRLNSDPPSADTTVLVPDGEVPGGADADAAYADTPAADYGLGAGGVHLPDPRATDNFSREQVLTALTLAKEYVVASGLTPEVLLGDTVTPVRDLLGAEQQRQFDNATQAHGLQSVPTDWLIRFDTDAVELADLQVRVDGGFTFVETNDDTLQVTARHVLAYALRAAGTGGEGAPAPVVVFTAHRQLRLQFGKEELRDRNVLVREVEQLLGPMDCAADPSDALRPLLPGERADPPAAAAVDPFALDGGRAVLCGEYAPFSDPRAHAPLLNR